MLFDKAIAFAIDIEVLILEKLPGPWLTNILSIFLLFEDFDHFWKIYDYMVRNIYMYAVCHAKANARPDTASVIFKKKLYCITLF